MTEALRSFTKQSRICVASVRCILTGMACAHVYIVIYGSCQYLSIVTISVINMGYRPMKPPKTSSLSIKGASALGSVKSIGRVVLKTPNMSFFPIELFKPAE